MLVVVAGARTSIASIVSALLISVASASCGEAAFDAPTSVADAGADGDGGEAAASGDAAAADSADAAPACKLRFTYGNAVCMACMAERCCEPITTCETDADCKPLQECALPCLSEPDAQGCYEACRVAHPNGDALWQKVYGCWFEDPESRCYIECTP